MNSQAENKHMWVYEKNLQQLSKTTAEIITQIITEKIAKEKSCLIALSGGSTPKILYSILAKAIKNWKNVYFIQVDERWVEVQHPQSNANMIAKQLFYEKFPKNFYVLKRKSNTAINENNTMLNTLMQQLHKKHIDITILGMGTDGHTASLFPDVQDFGSQKWMNKVNKQPYVLHYVPSQKMKRISLTPKILQQTEYSIALITGKEKQNTLNQAIKTKNKRKYPILMAMGKNHYWCTDFEIEKITQS